MYQETNMPQQFEPKQEWHVSQEQGIGAPYGPQGWSGQGQEERPKNYMALASMVLGILSVVTACCFFAGLVLGGLAVLFSALSRVDERLSGQGRTGLITGIVGLLLGFVSIVLWVLIGGGA